MIEQIINGSRFLRRRRDENKKIGKDEMEGLEKVARRISERDAIKVKFYDDACSTDACERDIRIPALALNEVEGLLSHVAGHIGYGSFSPSIRYLQGYLRKKYNLDKETSEQIINVCEDYRVDTINEKIFPGFARQLRILYHDILSKAVSKSFYRELLCYFEDLSHEFSQPIDPDQMELIDKAKQIIKNHQHIGATVFAADLLGKFFQKEDEKPDEPEPEQPPSEPPPPEMSCDMDCEGDNPMWSKSAPPNLSSGKGKKSKKNPKIQKGEPLKKENDNVDIKSDMDDEIEKYMEKFEKMDDEEIEALVNKFIEEEDKIPEKDTDLEEEAENLRQQLKYDCVHGVRIKGKRNCIMENIEPGLTTPLRLKHADIVRRHLRLITQLKQYFRFKQTQPEKQYKSGRLNNMFIRAVVSDYRRVFTRKVEVEKLKMTLLVDVSGSMGGYGGDKMEAAKEAMVIFAEALDEVANTRIVTFTGRAHAYNQVIKDFDEKIDPEKFDLIGSRRDMCENLDGVSVLNEALLNPKGVLLIFSDGRPAGSAGYGLETAIPDIQKAWTIVKTMFAFSINSKGEYLEQMYRRNFVNINYEKPMDLVNNVLKMARLMIEQIY